MGTTLRWGLSLGLLLVSEGRGEACSCIKGLADETAFIAWPQADTVYRNEHLWVQRPARAKGELALFANNKPLQAEIRPTGKATFEIIPPEPFAPGAVVEVRALQGDSARVVRRWQSQSEVAGPLPEGGELLRVETSHGNPFKSCGNGGPVAVLSFERFARPARRPAPYAVWFSRGTAPLDTSRPPDRVIFVEGKTLNVDSGTVCEEREYWLPTGEGEGRLAAAAIAPDGTRRAPREVPFRVAWSDSEQKVFYARCREQEKEVETRRSALGDASAAHVSLSLLMLRSAVAFGAVAAGLLAASRRWGKRLATIAGLAFVGGTAMALVSIREGRHGSDARAQLAAMTPRDDRGTCSSRYPDPWSNQSASSVPEPAPAPRLYLPPDSLPSFVAEANAKAAELAPDMSALLALIEPDCKLPARARRKTSPALGTPLARREDVLDVVATCATVDPGSSQKYLESLPRLRDIPRESHRSTYLHETPGKIEARCPSEYVDDDQAFELSLWDSPAHTRRVRVTVRGETGCFTEEGKAHNRKRREVAQGLVRKHGEAMRAAAKQVRCPATATPGFLVPAAALSPLSTQPHVLAASVACRFFDEHQYPSTSGERRYQLPGMDFPPPARASGHQQTPVPLGDEWVSVESPFDSIVELEDTFRLQLKGPVEVTLVVAP